MDGKNIYKTEFPAKFSIIFGNEGNGIRPSTEELISQIFTIDLGEKYVYRKP